MIADVEKKYGVDGGDVYTLALIDNKKIKASPARGPSITEPVNSAGNASANSISQNSEKSTVTSEKTLSKLDEAPLPFGTPARELRLKMAADEDIVLLSNPAYSAKPKCVDTVLCTRRTYQMKNLP